MIYRMLALAILTFACATPSTQAIYHQEPDGTILYLGPGTPTLVVKVKENFLITYPVKEFERIKKEMPRFVGKCQRGVVFINAGIPERKEDKVGGCQINNVCYTYIDPSGDDVADNLQAWYQDCVTRVQKLGPSHASTHSDCPKVTPFGEKATLGMSCGG